MKELKLTWSQDICIFDGYITKICEYLKTHNDETLCQMFPHLYRNKQVIAPLIPMMRFYPTSHGHVLKPLGEFVEHIIDQIEHYIEMMDKIPLPYMIPVLLPKIGTHGDEMLILVNNRSNNVISKLLDYYGSLKQGDDKMIALVYMKTQNGYVVSKILPYEVKYYKDDDSWTNVSIEFIDVFTNKKCTFEFKGDEIMGVNIKDNTSEGAAFEQALAFANKEKHKSVVRPKKVDEKCDNRECVCSTPTKSKASRPSKTDYYLDIAKAVAQRGTCLRRKFGAIIVKDDRIVSTGYVGAPRGRVNCCDRGKCFRMENNIPSGTRYELCRSTHAEMNAIINASKEEMEGATMYLVGIENDGSYTKNADCCSMCKRVVINSGIEKVIIATGEGKHKCINVTEWITNDDSLTLHEGY